jgi:hypothetical protein
VHKKSNSIPLCNSTEGDAMDLWSTDLKTNYIQLWSLYILYLLCIIWSVCVYVGTGWSTILTLHKSGLYFEVPICFKQKEILLETVINGMQILNASWFPRIGNL